LVWLDTKPAFRYNEMRNQTKSNPFMMGILEELKEINRKLDTKPENK
jgi:hypothetical protein